MEAAGLYEELENAKAEVSKLQEQYQVKAELAENLRKSYCDQLGKLKEASSMSEKLVQELNVKDEAISDLIHLTEELKSSLEQKEAIAKNIKLANDKLRDDFNAHRSKFEEESKALGLASDQANARNEEHEHNILLLKQEIDGVKRLLAISQNKCSESEKYSKECEGRVDDAFLKLGEENKKLQDELKWKVEQFDHLKQAHEKLLDGIRNNETVSENKEQTLSLDNESAKRIKQEQCICALEEEIEGLKRLLTASEKTRLEVENKVKAELGGREDVFLKLEEGSKKVEDQLKWKKEQFDHLKDAHEKLHEEFRIKEKEWEKENNMLLDEISCLQEKLESQVRRSKELQSRVEFCNQALAHAETKRMLLEVEITELKTNFGNVYEEYEEAKSKFETINFERDQEIGKMRSALATNNANYKEMEYQVRKMEQEKQDLLSSIKELRESRNQEADIVASSSMLQSKIQVLEQAHRGCLANLQAKECEWHSNMEKLKKDLNSCRFESESKDDYLNNLKMELQETRNQEAGIVASSSKIQNKLIYLETEHRGCLPNLQAKEYEWRSEMQILTDELNFCKFESERKDILLNELMELQEARIREANIISSSRLQNKFKSLKLAHEGCLAYLQEKESEWRTAMEKSKEDLDSCKLESETKDVYLNKMKTELEASESMMLKLEMLNQESSFMLLVLTSELSEALDNRSFVDLKNNEMEETNSGLTKELEIKMTDSKRRIQKDLEEHEKVVTSQTVQNLTESQLPLQKELEESVKCALRSEVEVVQMKGDLKKVHEALDRANEELYLQSCEVNEIEFELQYWRSLAEKLEVNLQQNAQLRMEMETSLISQTEEEMNLKLEKECLRNLVEEKDESVENLQQQLVELNEKETLHLLVEEKDQRISDLQHLVTNLEMEFESSISLFSSKLAHMQEERNLLRVSFEKMKVEKVFNEAKIHEKDLMIAELENDLSNLQQRVEFLNSSEGKVLEIQSELDSEISEKKELFEDMSLLSERFEQLRVEEEQLMENIARMVKHIDDEYDPKENKKENKSGSSTPLMKKGETVQEKRSPLMVKN